MMRATLIALFLAGGCGGAGALTASESALVSDSTTVDDSSDSLETGVEEPLSGAPSTDPGAVDPSTAGADQMTRVKTNPGLYFTPAGCITTTITGSSASSVFNNCRGPLNQHVYNGTVSSTWSFTSSSLTVTHTASGFQIDKATLDHQATITYTKVGTLYSRHRAGQTTGSTEGGETIDHQFDYTVTYDSASKCITRNGSSTGSVGSRSFSRSIDGYERCGIGSLGCPRSGTLKLSRTAPAPSLTLTLKFPGGARYEVTRANGTSFEGGLICIAN